ncbi:pentatricopeptide repeat (PPR-like) superfamily protein [Actinidia rufa]|uniref:Pentatricopeptide repeat (PPR-like) superfamily protein n=1 Tax=Actinidia rufa TaxID=165716 RepID=A0A7J0DZ02_9ERIC|nr:pentatricopeptide repeat (PPR-like) superfamily protein [Actinidia rufa]
MVSLLNASARLGAIRQGEWIHDYIRKKDIELNVIVVTAIIDMYCKCGSIENGLQVFETNQVKGLSSWNSIILGLATNGCEDEALQVFSRLESSEHEPDCVSFIGVLTACNHSGRAGLLREAEEVIRSMPMNPDAAIWGSLISACWKHGNVEIGQWVAKNLTELDPSESCGYVLMSNVYATSSHFEKAMQERISMKKKQIEKQPGCSSIEVDGEVHEFVAGSRLHPRIQEIYCISNN